LINSVQPLRGECPQIIGGLLVFGRRIILEKRNGILGIETGCLMAKQEICRVTQGTIHCLVEEGVRELQVTQVTPIHHGSGVLPINANREPTFEVLHGD
jgi:hypothetical protein